jgi:hypothetical protein
LILFFASLQWSSGRLSHIARLFVDGAGLVTAKEVRIGGDIVGTLKFFARL